MPIFTSYHTKISIVNAEKARGIAIECLNDMTLGELLDYVNQVRDEIVNEINKANQVEIIKAEDEVNVS